jgi:hypothetical protein
VLCVPISIACVLDELSLSVISVNLVLASIPQNFTQIVSVFNAEMCKKTSTFMKEKAINILEHFAQFAEEASTNYITV